jgi:hypothetical protein
MGKVSFDETDSEQIRAACRPSDNLEYPSCHSNFLHPYFQCIIFTTDPETSSG